MLLQNGRLDYQYPCSYLGSAILDSGNCINKDGKRFNRYYGAISLIASVPNGYLHPYAWIMEIKAGGMACTYGIAGSSSLSNGNLAGGRNIISLVESIGSLDTELGGKLSLSISISGTSDISNPLLAGSVNISSNITSIGQISSSTISAIGLLVLEILGNSEFTSNVTGSVLLEASIEGSGIIYQVSIAGGYPLEGVISSSSSLYSELNGLGKITANIEIGASPSALDITQSILSSIAADYNVPLTIGEKINSAGSAGDPWTTVLPGTYGEGTAGYLIYTVYDYIVKKVLTVAKFLGLR